MKSHLMRDDTFAMCGVNLFNMEMRPVIDVREFMKDAEKCEVCAKLVNDKIDLSDNKEFLEAFSAFGFHYREFKKKLGKFEERIFEYIKNNFTFIPFHLYDLLNKVEWNINDPTLLEAVTSLCESGKLKFSKETGWYELSDKVNREVNFCAIEFKYVCKVSESYKKCVFYEAVNDKIEFCKFTDVLGVCGNKKAQEEAMKRGT